MLFLLLFTGSNWKRNGKHSSKRPLSIKGKETKCGCLCVPSWLSTLVFFFSWLCLSTFICVYIFFLSVFSVGLCVLFVVSVSLPICIFLSVSLSLPDSLFLSVCCNVSVSISVCLSVCFFVCLMDWRTDCVFRAHSVGVVYLKIATSLVEYRGYLL